MTDLFEYAVIRLIPRIERGEQVNVGVILYCQAGDFLAVLTHIDRQRLTAVDALLDLDAVECALGAWAATCAGRGPAAKMTRGERFRWLTAPHSTMLQAGPVHTGLTGDPHEQLSHLLDRLVR